MSVNTVAHINSWFSKKYGTRRGALLTYWHRSLSLLGRYRAYRKVDWDSVERLVFVCSGNICRSPYAEVVARSMGIESISCGIDTVTGAPANAKAAKISAMRGYDLSQHKTTPIQSQRFTENDLLIAMEPWQVEYLIKDFPVQKCSLLGLWGTPKIPYIHDPYGSSSDYFQNCFDYIENAVHGIAKKSGNKDIEYRRR